MAMTCPPVIVPEDFYNWSESRREEFAKNNSWASSVDSMFTNVNDPANPQSCTADVNIPTDTIRNNDNSIKHDFVINRFTGFGDLPGKDFVYVEPLGSFPFGFDNIVALRDIKSKLDGTTKSEKNREVFKSQNEDEFKSWLKAVDPVLAALLFATTTAEADKATRDLIIESAPSAISLLTVLGLREYVDDLLAGPLNIEEHLRGTAFTPGSWDTNLEQLLTDNEIAPISESSYAFHDGPTNINLNAIFSDALIFKHKDLVGYSQKVFVKEYFKPTFTVVDTDVHPQTGEPLDIVVDLVYEALQPDGVDRSYTPPKSINGAFESVDNCDPDPVETYRIPIKLPLGVHYIPISSQDRAENTTAAWIRIRVVDEIPPDVEQPDSIAIQVQGNEAIAFSRLGCTTYLCQNSDNTKLLFPPPYFDFADASPEYSCTISNSLITEENCQDSFLPVGEVSEITWTALDNVGNRQTTIQKVAVRREGTNQIPTAENNALTVAAGIDLTIPLEAADPDFDPLTYAVTTSPANGSLVINGEPSFQTRFNLAGSVSRMGGVVAVEVGTSANQGVVFSDPFNHRLVESLGVTDGEVSNSWIFPYVIDDITVEPHSITFAGEEFRSGQQSFDHLNSSPSDLLDKMILADWSSRNIYGVVDSPRNFNSFADLSQEPLIDPQHIAFYSNQTSSYLLVTDKGGTGGGALWVYHFNAGSTTIQRSRKFTLGYAPMGIAWLRQNGAQEEFVITDWDNRQLHHVSIDLDAFLSGSPLTHQGSWDVSDSLFFTPLEGIPRVGEPQDIAITASTINEFNLYVADNRDRQVERFTLTLSPSYSVSGAGCEGSGCTNIGSAFSKIKSNDATMGDTITVLENYRIARFDLFGTLRALAFTNSDTNDSANFQRLTPNGSEWVDLSAATNRNLWLLSRGNVGNIPVLKHVELEDGFAKHTINHEYIQSNAGEGRSLSADIANGGAYVLFEQGLYYYNPSYDTQPGIDNPVQLLNLICQQGQSCAQDDWDQGFKQSPMTSTTIGHFHHVALDGQANVYLTESEHHRIHKFTQTGAYVGWLGRCTSGTNCNVAEERSIGFSCTASSCVSGGAATALLPGQFDFGQVDQDTVSGRPRYGRIKFDTGSDKFYVSDRVNSKPRVQVFNADGSFNKELYPDAVDPLKNLLEFTDAGEFTAINDIAARDDEFYVSEGSPLERVHVFDGSPFHEELSDSFLVYRPNFGFVGNEILNFQVTDGFDDSNNAEVTIHVIDDTTAPNITCPADIVIEGNTTGGASATAEPLGEGGIALKDFLDGATATDNTDYPLPVISNGAADVLPLGTNVITFTAADGASLENSCNATVTVIDTLAPEANAPSDIVVEASALLSEVELGVPVVTDTIGPVTLSNNAPTNGFPLGLTEVEWTVTDAAGNTTRVRQQVNVEDTTAPILTPEYQRITLIADNGYAKPIEFPLPTVSEAVELSDPLRCQPDNGDTAAAGRFTIHCVAGDSSGNIGSALVEIHIEQIDSDADGLADLTDMAPDQAGTLTFRDPDTHTQGRVSSSTALVRDALVAERDVYVSLNKLVVTNRQETLDVDACHERMNVSDINGFPLPAGDVTADLDEWGFDRIEISCDPDSVWVERGRVHVEFRLPNQLWVSTWLQEGDELSHSAYLLTASEDNENTIDVSISQDLSISLLPGERVDVKSLLSIIDTDNDGLSDDDEQVLGSQLNSTDSDGDGLSDGEEVHRWGSNPMLADSDGDGITDGDEVSLYGSHPRLSDTDNDGLSDGDEVNTHRTQATQWDSDNDGVSDGDEISRFATDPLTFTADADGDGVDYPQDQFPADPSRSGDRDGDGVADHHDAFPDDPQEAFDHDRDGVGDNADQFPADATETIDSDADGIGDVGDAFPHDASEWQDSDGDGIGDNRDQLPNDPHDSRDFDGDEIGDSWEIRYFGTLKNASANSDSNADGILDATAYANGDAPWTQGPIHTGLKFDGIDDHLILPDDIIVANSALTLEFWFNSRHSGILFGYQDTAYGAQPNHHVPAIYIDRNGRLRAQFWHGSHAPITTLTAVNDGRWHHVALAGDNNGQSLYVDGQRVGSLTGALQHLTMSKAQFGVGYVHPNSLWPFAGREWVGFNGAIDEVRLWDSRLDQAAVQSAMYTRMSGNEAGLLLSFTLNEGQGTQAADVTVNANHATLAGNAQTPEWFYSQPPASADSDNDNLNDQWELFHFGDLSRTANGDEDGDGFSNDEEEGFLSDPSVAFGKWVRIAGHTQGYQGDGGLAELAGFDEPQGLGSDALGNLVIADRQKRVRRISRGGGIDTWVGNADRANSRYTVSAGATGPLTSLFIPQDAALDSQGVLYVLDHGRLLRYGSNNIGEDLAGGGATDPLLCNASDGSNALNARFDFVNDVVVDSHDRLFINDNACLRIFDISQTGIVTAKAGSGQWGNKGPAPIGAVDPLTVDFNDTLHFTRDRNGGLLISEEDVLGYQLHSDGLLRHLLGTTDNEAWTRYPSFGEPALSSVYLPQVIEAGPHGGVFIAEPGVRGNGFIIQWIHPTLKISIPVAGRWLQHEGIPTALEQPVITRIWDMELGADGHLYIADDEGGAIWRFELGPDLDGDGVPLGIDAFPDDNTRWSDWDRDGLADFNGDDPFVNDSDNDGVANRTDQTIMQPDRDDFPFDPTETRDSDNNGIGDNAQVRDRDGDGVADIDDPFPDNPNESSDRDGDGVGDNSDSAPDDPAYGANEDSDADGIGDQWERHYLGGLDIADDQSDLNHDGLGDKQAYDLGQQPWTQGPAPTVLRFDGVDDFVSLPDGIIQSSRIVAVDLWLRTEARDGVVLSYKNPQGTQDVPILYVGNDGRLHGQFWRDEGGALLHSPMQVNDGQWHHVVLTSDGERQWLYIDGALVATQAGTINHLEMTQAQLGTGLTTDFEFTSGGQRAFSGDIDEVRIWHRHLNSEAVLRVQNRQFSGGERGLAAYWALDAGVGLLSPDHTGSSEHVLELGDGDVLKAPLWRWAWVANGLDSDQDGMTDAYESAHGLNPRLMADRLNDDDLDGLTAIEEFHKGLHPGKADTDEDGVADSEDNDSMNAIALSSSDLQTGRVAFNKPAYQRFSDSYSVEPVVILGVLDKSDETLGIGRVLDVSTDGFEVEYRSWETDARSLGSHSAAWLALPPGRYRVGDAVWEVGRFNLKDQWFEPVFFTEPFAGPPKVFASQQYTRNKEAAVLRIRDIDNHGFFIALHEREADALSEHNEETIAYLAIYDADDSGLATTQGTEMAYSLLSSELDSESMVIAGHHLYLEEETSFDAELQHQAERFQTLTIDNGLYASLTSLRETDTVTIRRVGDLDGDHINDQIDSDDDGDGFSDAYEIERGWNPKDQGWFDSDNDGINDEWELWYFLNLHSADADSDSNSDGLSDYQAFLTAQSPWNSGEAHTALYFDGNDSVALPNQLVGAPEQSVELYFSTTDQGALLGVYDNVVDTPPPTSDNNWRPILWVGLDGHLYGHFYHIVGFWGHAPSVRSPEPVNDGEIYHAVLTADAQTLSLYINGELVDELQDDFTVPTSGERFNVMGTAPTHPDQVSFSPDLSLTFVSTPGDWFYFKGWMDELHVWNKRLSADDVTDRFNALPDSNTVALKARFDFNEGSRLRFAEIDGRVADGTFSDDQSAHPQWVYAPRWWERDRDGDGVRDYLDAAPDDAHASSDRDGDRVADPYDRFPDNASESEDSDHDRIGDHWEQRYFGDLNVIGANSDSNNDGLLDRIAFETGDLPWTQGPVYTALYFDGVNDELTLPDGLISDQLPITIEMWFNSDFPGVLLGSQNTRDSAPSQFMPTVYIGDDGKLRAQLDSTTINPMVSASAVDDGEWHHLAVVADNTFQALYVNGVLEDQRTGTVDHSALVYSQIGRGFASGWPMLNRTESWYEGAIKELRFWSAVLTQEQIVSNKDRTLNGDENGLYAYYVLRQTVIERIADLSGQQGDAVLGNGIVDQRPQQRFAIHLDQDSDGDGIADADDDLPYDASNLLDTDGDRVADSEDAFPHDAAASIDSDGDGHPDDWNEGMSAADSVSALQLDLDDDNDGILDVDDPFPLVSDLDIDNDGLRDGWEQFHFGDITTTDGNGDQDGDGLTDSEEMGYGTDPLNSDSDGDGDSDFNEIRYQTNPLSFIDDLNSHRPFAPLVLVPTTAVPLEGHIFDSSPFDDPDIGLADRLTASQWQLRLRDSDPSELILDQVIEAKEDALEIDHRQLVISTSLLSANTNYLVRTRHRDVPGLWSPWSEERAFTTVATDPNDSDGNGINDAFQIDGFSDANQNGTADQDEGIIAIFDAEQNSVVGIHMEEINGALIDKITAIPSSELLAEILPEQGFPHGLFSFRITGLPIDTENPASVEITFYFDSLILETSILDGVEEINRIDATTAPALYWLHYNQATQTLTDITEHVRFEGNAVVLTVVDGGVIDADGIVNGIIVDPSGLSTSAVENQDDKQAADSGGSGGNCFIATAAYGSYLEPEVVILRRFRDNYLLTNEIGSAFVDFYYQHSPPIAAAIAEHEWLKYTTRVILTALIYSVKHPFIVLAVLLMSVVLWRKQKALPPLKR